jgi:hypothetical protein
MNIIYPPWRIGTPAKEKTLGMFKPDNIT